MDAEVAKLVDAFRGELEGCHRLLDDAGVLRVVGSRVLSLRDRIAVLVAADREYSAATERELRELRARIQKPAGRRRR